MTVTVSTIERIMAAAFGLAGGKVTVYDFGQSVEIPQIGIHCPRLEADDIGAGADC